MQSTADFLRLYREIRDAINDIHALAAAIEGDLGCWQIYREQASIPRALNTLQDLAAKIAFLEEGFQLCAQQSAPISAPHKEIAPVPIVPSSLALTQPQPGTLKLRGLGEMQPELEDAQGP
jgi:hypothetical protein